MATCEGTVTVTPAGYRLVVPLETKKYVSFPYEITRFPVDYPIDFMEI